MSDPVIDHAELLRKTKVAIAAVFEVERMLVPRTEHPKWSDAFDARCSLGKVEDYALRELGIRGN